MIVILLIFYEKNINKFLTFTHVCNKIKTVKGDTQ
nr:MAG TPA: hypothetical protein [Caudoviricetes sp.]